MKKNAFFLFLRFFCFFKPQIKLTEIETKNKFTSKNHHIKLIQYVGICRFFQPVDNNDHHHPLTVDQHGHL